MTTAMIILGLISLGLLIMMMILYSKLNKTQKVIQELSKLSNQERIDSITSLLEHWNKRLEEGKKTLEEHEAKLAEYQFLLDRLPEIIKDPDKIAEEFNRLFDKKAW